MPAEKTISALFNLTPKEAADYLQGRSKLTPTFSHQDLMHEEHTTQFTISRLARMDIMQSMYDGLVKSVDGDLSRRDWMRNSRDLLQKEGWWGKKTITDPATGELVTTTFNAARLDLIYDTNTRIAYSAGLWERMMRNKDSHPYVRYISMHDRRVRPQHLAWDNITLPIEDSFWETHYPPNGYRCRCRAMSVSQAEYDSGKAPTGAALKKDAPPITYKTWINKRTGVIERVPTGIDPGFAYNPGKAAMREKSLAAIARTKLDLLPAPIRKAALAPSVIGSVDGEWHSEIEKALDEIAEPIRKAVFAAGYEVKLANMLVDIRPDLSEVWPRGYPTGCTWKNVDGACFRGDKLVAIAQTCINHVSGKPFSINTKRSVSVALHEYGHALDDAIGATANNDFISAYNSDLAAIDGKRLSDDEKMDVGYMTQSGKAGREEVFAEIFAALYGGRTAYAVDAIKLFPQTVRYVQALIKGVK